MNTYTVFAEALVQTQVTLGELEIRTDTVKFMKEMGVETFVGSACDRLIRGSVEVVGMLDEHDLRVEAWDVIVHQMEIWIFG